VASEVDSLSGTVVFPQFQDTLTNRLAITKQALFQPLYANTNSGLFLLFAN
jgi:hypothetical protein